MKELFASKKSFKYRSQSWFCWKIEEMIHSIIVTTTHINFKVITKRIRHLKNTKTK